MELRASGRLVSVPVEAYSCAPCDEFEHGRLRLNCEIWLKE